MSLYTNEDRFSMTAERYLAKHHVLVYLEDSISQLLEHREENPKINPIKILSEYFTSLRDGNHTMFREYQFIHLTPHNRASFVKLFWKCYKQIGKKGDLLSIQEYHSLVTLLCPDFPFELVQKTARIILLDDALDCLISFTDFIYAFQVQFYYEEFLDKCLEIYQSLIQTQSSPRNPVVVPSGTDDLKVHMNSHHPGDGVDAMQYFRAVYPLCDRSTFSTPPADGLKEVLFNVQRVSFYGFLMAIAKSDSINEHIGRLPPKAELLEGPDTEITSAYVVNASQKPSVEEQKLQDQTNKHNTLIKKRVPSSKKNESQGAETIIHQENNNHLPPQAQGQGHTSKQTTHQQQQQQQPSQQSTQPQLRSRSISRNRNNPRSNLSVPSRHRRKLMVSSDDTTTDSDDDDDTDDD